jgi:hypothetical protein
VTEQDRREWHLDRRFSFALILTIIGQIGTGVWFAAKMDSRVAALEERFLAQQATIERRHLELQTIIVENRKFQVDQRIRVWDQVRAQGEAQNDFRAEVAGISARLDYITRALDRLTLLNDQRVRDDQRSRSSE